MTECKEFSQLELDFMQQALALAEKGRYTSAPNPCVGAVVVLNDQLVGKGWHQKAGGPHAEIAALDDAGEACRGSTVYVTLEPCCHQGRTGPCTEALIEAGVKRVVYAMPDPNPIVSGRGAERLKEAGVDVAGGLMQKQASELNRGYISRMQRQRPYVTLKLAASLDGRSAMASGESQWITGPLARQDAQKLRAQSCAILTGSGTVMSDDPRYSVRESDLGELVQRQPGLWVCDSNLSVSPQSKIVSTLGELNRSVVLVTLASTANKKSQETAALADCGVEVLVVKPTGGRGESGLDLTAMFSLMNDHETNELLVEAGPRLSGSLVACNLVDEIVYYLAPKFLGASAKPVLDLQLEKLEEAFELEVSGVETLGDDWKITGVPVAGR